MNRLFASIIVIILEYFGQMTFQRSDDSFDVEHAPVNGSTKSTEALLYQLNSTYQMCNMLTKLSEASQTEYHEAIESQMLERTFTLRKTVKELYASFFDHFLLIINAVRDGELEMKDSEIPKVFEQRWHNVSAIRQRLHELIQQNNEYLHNYNNGSAIRVENNTTFKKHRSTARKLNRCWRNVLAQLKVLKERYSSEFFKIRDELQKIIKIGANLQGSVLEGDNLLKDLNAGLEETTIIANRTCKQVLYKRYLLLMQINLRENFSILHEAMHETAQRKVKNIQNLIRMDELELEYTEEHLKELRLLLEAFRMELAMYNFSRMQHKEWLLEGLSGFNMTEYMNEYQDILSDVIQSEVHSWIMQRERQQIKAEELKTKIALLKKNADELLKGLPYLHRQSKRHKWQLDQLIENQKFATQCIQNQRNDVKLEHIGATFSPY